MSPVSPGMLVLSRVPRKIRSPNPVSNPNPVSGTFPLSVSGTFPLSVSGTFPPFPLFRRAGRLFGGAPFDYSAGAGTNPEEEGADR
jgi:hypothetical protein